MIAEELNPSALVVELPATSTTLTTSMTLSSTPCPPDNGGGPGTQTTLLNKWNIVQPSHGRHIQWPLPPTSLSPIGSPGPRFTALHEDTLNDLPTAPALSTNGDLPITIPPSSTELSKLTRPFRAFARPCMFTVSSQTLPVHAAR